MRKRRDIYNIARPEVADLAQETGELTNSSSKNTGWESTSVETRAKRWSRSIPTRVSAFISNLEMLYDELDEIRERGIAFDDKERLTGLRCIAAPILNENETVEGAISITGPSRRLQDERFRNILPESILDAKNIIELNLTYG